uniref:Uncharacterized protein n=1 Tax=Spongospora subterranea TaxID=70186 RepID=A0A0H5QHN9_9EUKA|eukprot:CRZ01172.1 hypothetical protein [Spongospora subterranea]
MRCNSSKEITQNMEYATAVTEYRRKLRSQAGFDTALCRGVPLSPGDITYNNYTRRHRIKQDLGSGLKGAQPIAEPGPCGLEKKSGRSFLCCTVPRNRSSNMSLFGKRPDPQDQVKTWISVLKKEQRGIDSEIRSNS